MERLGYSSECSRLESSPLSAKVRNAVGIALLSTLPISCTDAHTQTRHQSEYPVTTVYIPSAEAQFDEVTYADYDLEPAETENTEHKNCTAHEKLPASQVSYLEVGNYYGGLALARDESGWFYIDVQGNPITDERFDDADDFSEGFAKVTKKNKVYYIDGQGNYVQDPKIVKEDDQSNLFASRFDLVREFHEGMASVELGSNSFFIDKKGAIVFPMDPQFSYDDFSEGLSSVTRRSDHKGSHVDRVGQFAYQKFYDFTGDFREGLAVVGENGQWFHITDDGNPAYQERFDDVSEFHDGLALARKDGQFFFIKRDGSRANENTYELANSYHEGMAAVMQEGRWFHIGTSGQPYPQRVVCEPK